MRMQPRYPLDSFCRLLLTNTIKLKSKPARSLVLLGLIAVATTALASTVSSAGSLRQFIFGLGSTNTGGSVSQPKAALTNPLLMAPVPDASTSMTVERKGHSATLLGDGRVLIVGGENSGGLISQSEIFDPTAGTFAVGGNLNSARTDHSATRLADGRVLIAGGRGTAGALTTTEIFDPTTGAFASGPEMSVARAGHSATLFADGRVFIAGGDATGSAEIFDPSSSAFSAVGASMSASRSMHSAALLADGRVLLVGGRNAAGDALSSGEIFDPAGSSFSAVAGQLTVARVLPHLRVLFDGKVQIIGGSNDGSMEIYDPTSGAFGAYAHVEPEGDTCVGLPAQVRASQTRAALFHNGQSDETFDRTSHSISELASAAIVVGGVNSSGAVLSSTPLFSSSNAQISTDKLDYAPGETALISGRGFQPGETVRLKIHEDPHTPQERGFETVADADGNFSGEYLVADYDLAMKFFVGARGLTSGATAQTTFTDGNINVSGTVTNIVTGLPIAGASVSCSSNCSGAAITNGSGNYVLNMTFPTNGPILVQITASAAGFTPASLSFIVNQGTNQFNRNFALTPNLRSTATTVSCTPNPTVVGGGVTCTAAVIDTAAGTPTPPSGTVNLSTGGPGTFTPAASCSLTPVNATTSNCAVTYTPNLRGTGIHNINANYGGSSIHSGSASSAFALTVNKADQTIAFAALADKTYGDAPFVVSATGGASGNPVTFSAVGNCASGGLNGSTITILGAGSCTVTASQIGNADYNAAANVLRTFTVNPKTLTASIVGNPTKPYDGNTNATLTSANYSLSGLVGSDSFTLTKTTGSYNDASVALATTVSTSLAPGDFTPVGGTLASNYTLPTTASGAGQINKALVTATAGSGSNVYDGATHAPSACAVTGAYIGGLSCVNNPASVGPNIGTTAISPVTSGADLANFTVTAVDGSYTISPAEVTATAGSGSGSYNGATQSPSVCVVSGAYIGALSCVNNPASVGPNIGTTVISPITSGADLSNFTVTPVDGSYTINPALVTATAGSGSNVYDGATHAPSACVVTGAYIGALSCVNNPASVGPNIGTTVISPVTSGADLANFTVTPVDGSYTISPALVTATAGSGSNVYDGATHAPSACVVTGAYIGGLSCVNNPASVGPNIGTTVISPVTSGADLANFTVTPVDGSYLIDQRPATWTTNAASKTYGDSDPVGVTTGSGSNFVVSDGVTATYSRVAGENASPPTYHITATLSATGDLNNYIITNAGAEFTINKATVTVTPSSGQSKVYGTGDPALTYTASGLTNGDTVSVFTGALSRAAGENVGNYTITLGSLSAGGNYNTVLSATPVTFAITKATVTVTPSSGQSKVYGSSDPALTYTASGLTNGDTVSVFTGALARAAGANVGNYTITLGSLSAGGNYNTVLSATPVTFAITKRPITVTAVTNTKIYDGNTSSLGIPTVTSGTIVSGDTGNFTQTFNTALVGTGKTLTPAGSVSDGNGGLNYLITFATVNTGVITTGYCFQGFLSPIGGSVETLNGGTYADPLRAFKLGSTIPVKFVISSWNGTTCGAPVITGIHTLQAAYFSSATDGDTPIDATPTDAVTTGNQFRLTDAEWHFNLSTKGGGFKAGTWLLTATLQDGSIHTVWITIKK